MTVFSVSERPCNLVLKSPHMYNGVICGIGIIISASLVQNLLLRSECSWSSFWMGAYTPRNTRGMGDAETWTSIIRSEWHVIDEMWGRSQGAIITPTPVAGVVADEKINV